MTRVERRTTAALASVFAMRMLGLFVILPVLSIYGADLSGATPLLIGIAVGAYGLAQGILQIPFGMLSDRVGRKPVIYAALALFAVGGLVAAASTSIWGVIAGRAIQGCGAVSGVVMALQTDLTREVHRPRAMAVIGATVGLSFALALVLGPLLAGAVGLTGLFVFTSLMAVASLLLVAFCVPTPIAERAKGLPAQWPQLATVLRHPGLLRLNAGIFLLHLVMVVVFIVLPPSLVAEENLPPSAHWRIYLPVVLLSLLVMIPLMRVAERRGRVRETLLTASILLGISLLVLAVLHRSLWGVLGGLLLYFIAFNLLEAMMPSLVSRMSPAGARGAAMGVFSSGQFLGAFAGGIVGGALVSRVTPGEVLALVSLVFFGWTVLAAGLRDSVRRREIELSLPPGAGLDTARALVARILSIDGVLEATAVPEDGVVSVIVDIARCDEVMLHDIVSRATWAPS